jgi:hypothetical protein
MVKTKKDKKTKVKKIANVLQRVTVNVQPAKPRSRNTKAYVNNGFNQFQAQSRQIANLPNQIKEILGSRQEATSAIYETQLKELQQRQDYMDTLIKARVEKQSLDKYLTTIGESINKNLKEIKSGTQDFPSGTPIII